MTREKLYLEVGCNDQGEVVINHPDLKPDENGVGHIVFSPNQARSLAGLLLKHAVAAEAKKSLTSFRQSRHIRAVFKK